MCIFCKIVNNEIPSYKIYEDDACLAFLDISQTTIGHTLVIPKKHYDNIFSLDDEISSKILGVVSKLSKKLSCSLKIKDINIINNNGTLAGQTVNHFHMHIVPRYSDNDLKIDYISNKLTTEELIKLQQKILDN